MMHYEKLSFMIMHNANLYFQGYWIGAGAESEYSATAIYVSGK